jgi:ring-1,2-phenylacetyl-CoA epoxidase subunit PaaE
MLPFPTVTSASPLFREVRIVGVRAETSEAKVFTLAPEGWEMTYRAGQFLTFVIPSPSGLIRRSYSLCSAPGEAPSIAVKRVANGVFSRPLLESAEPGDRLTVAGGPSGFFTLPTEPGPFDQLLFFAAGSGITPVFGLINEALRTSHARLLLAFSNPHPASTMFREALEELERKHSDRLSIAWYYSHQKDLMKARQTKTTLDLLLSAHLTADPDRAMAFVCGPFDYMRMVAIVLQSRGIPAENIRREVFTPDPIKSKEKPPDTAKRKATLRIGGRVHVVDVQYPATILAAARSVGVELPYSCESGRCGSCIAACTQGKVWMRYNEVLTDREVANGRVLVCQSFPVGGDVTIEYA